MNITLDQVKAFEAVANLGTVQSAAKYLNKGHSAVLYLIKSLEDQSGVQLFDRRGYRNKLTTSGEVVLKYCKQMLATHSDLTEVCQKLKAGWEPKLKLIYDGVIEFSLIGDALMMLAKSQTPTEIKVLAAHLHEVETKYLSEQADFMVTILPIRQSEISFLRLKSFTMHLVCHKDYFLSSTKIRTFSTKDLLDQTFIQLGGAGNNLGFSTEEVPFKSSFLVNDFATKKQAIVKGLGFGWLPEYLIQSELNSKKLVRINSDIETVHELSPRLYHKKEELLGRSAKQLLNHFKSK